VAENLGQQAELQAAINKAIADRAALLEKQNNLLSNQAQLEANLRDLASQRDQTQQSSNSSFREAAAAAAEQAESQQESMQNQLSLAERLRGEQQQTNDLTAAAAEENEKNNGTLEDAAAVWDKTKKNSKEYFKNLIKKAGPAGAAIVGMARGLKDVANAFKGIGGLLSSVIGGIMKIGKAIIAAPFKMIEGLAEMSNNAAQAGQGLRDATEKVREEFSGLADGVGGKVMSAFKSARKSAKNFGDTGRSVSSIYGYGPDGMAKMLEDMSDTASGLEKAMSGLTMSLGKKGLEKLTAFKKGLGLSGDELGQLAKSARLSGQSMDEMMARVGNAAKGMGDKFDIPAKLIAKDIASMKTDFVTFGHMAETEMAGVSAYAKKLGVDVKDLKGVMDKYMSFEGAAESVSALNQAFGMQIDTMAMMSAQNPADQVEMLRQSFFATGKSIENMTIQEKKLLQQQTGMSDAMMQSAFSAENQGMAYKDMQDQADKDKKKKLDQTKVLKSLADALVKFTGMGKKLGGVGKQFSDGIMKAISLHPEIQKLMKTNAKFLREVHGLGFELGKLSMDLLAKAGLFDALNDILDSKDFIVFKNDIIKAFKELGEWMFDESKTGSPDSIIKKFGDAFAKFGDAKKGPMGKLGAALTKIGDVMAKLLKAALKLLWKKAIKPGLKYLWETIKKNKWQIINALLPIFGIIFGYVLLKGLVFGIGTALISKGIPALVKGIKNMGKAKKVTDAARKVGFMSKMGKAIVKGGSKLSGAFKLVGKGGLKAFGKVLSTGLKAIPVVGWVASIAIDAAFAFSDAVDRYKETGSLAEAGKGFVGSFLSGLTLGMVSKEWFEDLIFRGTRQIDVAVKKHNKLAEKEAEAFGKRMKSTFDSYNSGFKKHIKDREGMLDSMAESFVKHEKKLNADEKKLIKEYQKNTAVKVALQEQGLKESQALQGKLKAREGARSAALKLVEQELKNDQRWHDKYDDHVTLSRKNLDQAVVDALRAKGLIGSSTAKSITIDGDRKQEVIKLLKSYEKNQKDIEKELSQHKRGIDVKRQHKLLDQNIGDMKKQFLAIKKIGGKTAAIEKDMREKLALEAKRKAVVDAADPHIKAMMDMDKAMGFKTDIDQMFKMQYNAMAAKSKEKAAEWKARMAVKIGKEFIGLTKVPLSETQKQAEKLGKLEAAKRTMERIKELKEVPAKLKELSASLKGIKVDTLKPLIKQSFKVVSDIADVISETIKKEGLDKKSSVALSENVGKTMASIGEVSKALATIVAGKFPSQKSIGKRVDAINMALSKIQFIIPEGYAISGLGGGELVQEFTDFGFVLDAAKNIILNIPADIDQQYVQVGYLSNVMDQLGTVASHTKTFHKTWGKIKVTDNDAFAMANKIMEETPKDIAALDALLPFRIAATKKLTQVANVTSGFLAAIGKVVVPDNMKVSLFGSAKSLIGKDSKKKILNTMQSLAEIVIGGNAMLAPVSDIEAPFKQLTSAIHAMDMVVNRYNKKYFGPSGKLVKVMRGLGETYNEVYNTLFDLAASPYDLDLKLDKFVNAMGVDKDTFTVQNDKLNFTINVKVELDAEKFSDAMTDEYTMGAKAIALAKP